MATGNFAIESLSRQPGRMESIQDNDPASARDIQCPRNRVWFAPPRLVFRRAKFRVSGLWTPRHPWIELEQLEDISGCKLPLLLGALVWSEAFKGSQEEARRKQRTGKRVPTPNRLRTAQVLGQYLGIHARDAGGTLDMQQHGEHRKYLEAKYFDHASPASTGLGHRPGGADDVTLSQPDCLGQPWWSPLRT
ncbi:uncharacterized protein N7459_008663 [Penicillium hispanicum]|uniref:uncharacterized protein n=1 Tax=Penicillium hispanicum TaxID=1080232 RepID=UPI00253F993B|nr:uncharacterized protein N7459_008663 [Penicillium hispanicum]KAJ5574236.1 hypothetical protein N7459_008663 [Penicillium hispanicum]